MGEEIKVSERLSKLPRTHSTGNGVWPVQVLSSRDLSHREAQPWSSDEAGHPTPLAPPGRLPQAGRLLGVTELKQEKFP